MQESIFFAKERDYVLVVESLNLACRWIIHGWDEGGGTLKDELLEEGRS